MESLWKILVVFECVYFMKMYQVVWSRDRLPTIVFIRGFPRGSDGKESACVAGDLSSIPGLRRSPGGWHGNPLQYSCLEKPHGWGSLAGYSPWGHKELDMTEWLRTACQVFHLQFRQFFSMCSHCSRKFKHVRRISEQWLDFQPQLCMEHRVRKDAVVKSDQNTSSLTHCSGHMTLGVTAPVIYKTCRSCQNRATLEPTLKHTAWDKTKQCWVLFFKTRYLL